MSKLRKLMLGGALAMLCCALVGNILAEPTGNRTPAKPPTRVDPAERVEPHPLSPARARIDEQRRLFSRLDLALAGSDFEEARRLLALHDAEFSEAEAWSDWRAGYQCITDCLEHPGGTSAAAGQRFVEKQRGSRLRRRVRRACLR